MTLEHLGPRAVVLGQCEHAAGGLAALAEDLDVRVPEAVDGLELVADEEEILASASRSTSSHWRRFVSWNSSTSTERKRQLSRSRIAGWSRSRFLAFSWRSSKSSADSRLLRGGVGVGEAPQELLEEPPVPCRELVERRLLDARGAPPRSSRTGHAARRGRPARRGRSAARPRAGARAARARAPRSPGPSRPSPSRPCPRARSAPPRAAPRSARRGPAGRRSRGRASRPAERSVS